MELAALAYQEDALTNWASQPEPIPDHSKSLKLSIVTKELILWSSNKLWHTDWKTNLQGRSQLVTGTDDAQMFKTSKGEAEPKDKYHQQVYVRSHLIFA